MEEEQQQEGGTQAGHEGRAKSEQLGVRHRVSEQLEVRYRARQLGERMQKAGELRKEEELHKEKELFVGDSDAEVGGRLRDIQAQQQVEHDPEEHSGPAEEDSPWVGLVGGRLGKLKEEALRRAAEAGNVQGTLQRLVVLVGEL